MKITGVSKVVCSLIATLVIAASAAGQTPGKYGCQSIGGFGATNLGGFGPNTTMGPVVGDFAGAVGIEVLGITTASNGVVDIYVQHHWVTNEGDTLTVDKAHAYGVYVLPGLFAITDYKVHISGGTGRYQNMEADIVAIGEADFNTGQLALRFTGQLCRVSH